MPDRPHAIIIGAGFTGCATAHDLALRGCDVTVVERGEIASGTSGRTHGLLHSGGRYCVNDPEAGVECIEENIILRKIAKQCIEFNGGLFIALDENDLAYGKAFIEGAQACHIPIEQIQPAEARRLEPNLNPRLLAAFSVPDGAFDPLRLALAFAATARKNGARFFTYHDVTGLALDGKGNVCGVEVWERAAGQKHTLKGDVVVNATGAWAEKIAGMAQRQRAGDPDPRGDGRLRPAPGAARDQPPVRASRRRYRPAAAPYGGGGHHFLRGVRRGLYPGGQRAGKDDVRRAPSSLCRQSPRPRCAEPTCRRAR